MKLLNFNEPKIKLYTVKKDNKQEGINNSLKSNQNNSINNNHNNLNNKSNNLSLNKSLKSSKNQRNFSLNNLNSSIFPIVNNNSNYPNSNTNISIIAKGRGRDSGSVNIKKEINDLFNDDFLNENQNLINYELSNRNLNVRTKNQIEG